MCLTVTNINFYRHLLLYCSNKFFAKGNNGFLLLLKRKMLNQVQKVKENKNQILQCERKLEANLTTIRFSDFFP